MANNDSVISIPWAFRRKTPDGARETAARRRVIITGATSGLGLALARRFIAAGWIVGATGRNAAALTALQKEAPENVTTMQLDVNTADAPERLVELAAALGGMDLYLHCAGILLDNPGLQPDREVSMAMTNAVGMARMLAAAFGYFRDSGRRGRIVAISSVAGCRGLGDMPAYSASKAFDQAYIEALRQEAHRLRLPLRVVDIRPGWTRTPLLDPDRKYLFEMPAERVADMIFHAALHARRTATIGLRWRVLTALERLVPAALWQRLHLPLWRDK